MDIKEVEKVAKLARLEFSEEEKKKIPDQLTKILGFIDQLKKIETSDIEPMTQPLGDEMGELRMNEDRLDEFIKKENLTAIAPEFKDGFYRVKKVIE